MKKKKLTYNSLALGNLKNRKKQYTLLIIGIILSMTFSACVPFLISSSISSTEATKNALYGSEDLIFNNVTPEIKEHLENSFATVGYAETFGFLSNPEGEKESGFCFANFDNTSSQMYIELKEGSLPTNSNEIAVEENALLSMGMKATVGDKLTFDLYPQKQNELSEKSQKVEFILTGILKNKRQNVMGATQIEFTEIPAAIVSDDYLIAPGGKSMISAFASTECAFSNEKEYYKQFDNYYSRLPETLEAHINSFEISGYIKYDFLSEAMGISSPTTLLALLAFVFALISDIGVINAFNSNLKERKKQIGLLRSVGATKRQIIKAYGRETFILSLIAVPISTVLSAASVGLIMPLLGENYVFKPEFWMIPLAILISLIFVVIASFIPLISASRISPMQAIRNTELGRKFKNKKIKTQKQFDAPKLLASRHITLFKHKGVITSVILSLSIVISCFGFSFVSGYIDKFEAYENDYLLSTTTHESSSFLSNYTEGNNKGFNENQVYDILSNQYVEEVNLRKVTKAYISKGEFTDFMHSLCYLNLQYQNSPKDIWVTKENYKEYSEFFSAEHYFAKESADIKDDILPLDLFGFDEASLEGLKECIAYGDIDIEKLNSGEEIILYVPEELILTASHWEDDYKYSNISAYPTKEFYSEVDEILLNESKCDFKVDEELTVGWLSADKMPETEYDIYTLKENQPKIDYTKSENKSKIGAVLHSVPSTYNNEIYQSLSWSEGARIITTIDGFDKLTKNSVDYANVAVNLNTECTDEIDIELTNLFTQVCGGVDYSVNSAYEYKQGEEKLVKAQITIIIAVVALLFTACGSMINNSITARIRENKKEIGTLRAVGATQKDINNSYIRQLISILGWGTVSGFLMYCILFGLYCLIFISMGDTVDDFKFRIIETVLGTILLFVSCIINAVLKIKKEMKHSIVENIREL